MRASRNNRSCNLLSKPFFTIVRDHSPEFTFGDCGEPIRRAAVAGRVHAHVEGSVRAKREAALRIVDLRRRNAEVEENPIDFANALGIEDLRQFRKLRAMESETR